MRTSAWCDSCGRRDRFGWPRGLEDGTRNDAEAVALYAVHGAFNSTQQLAQRVQYIAQVCIVVHHSMCVLYCMVHKD